MIIKFLSIFSNKYLFFEIKNEFYIYKFYSLEMYMIYNI